jgi:hypothetical protein
MLIEGNGLDTSYLHYMANMGHYKTPLFRRRWIGALDWSWSSELGVWVMDHKRHYG